jgi:hypothetical protein
MNVSSVAMAAAALSAGGTAALMPSAPAEGHPRSAAR